MADDEQGETMVPTDVLLRPDQFDRVEQIAARTGTDRSAVLRRLLDLGLAYAGDETTDEASE